MQLNEEILELMNTNATKIIEEGVEIITVDKAVEIALIFARREAQRAALRSSNSVLLGVSSQLAAGSIVGSDGFFDAPHLVGMAKDLIAAVEAANE